MVTLAPPLRSFVGEAGLPPKAPPNARCFVTSSATHYDLLGVPATASAAEVRAAYRRLAVRYHPDKHLGNPHFEELFKQVAEAYRVLHHPARRAAYDGALHAARERQAALLRQQRQAGANAWPVGHRYHYASTRPPASTRERAYHTVQQRAQFNRRDRRILLVLLIFLTTAAGAVAMWRDARSEAQADEVYLEGMLALKRGDWAAAMTDWSAAIREEPTYGAAYARRAEAASFYQHDYQTALADYNVALRHLRAPADRVRTLTGRAGCLAALGREAAAEQAYSQALSLDASFAPARLARAELRLFGRRDYSGAITDFSRVLRSATASPAECARAVKERGIAHFRLGDRPRAIHDLLAALSADTTDGQACHLLSKLAAAAGQPERAAAYAVAAEARGYRAPVAMRK